VTDYDFVIVGAGIAGVSLAFELAPSGRVAVFEAEDRPGMHATGRSAALFAPSYGGREFRAITRASRAFFDTPPTGFTDHPLLNPRGCLYIARADQLASLKHMRDSIVASGGSVSEVSAQEAVAMVPKLRDGYTVAAVFDEDATDIDVDAVLQGFLRAARARGATLSPRRRFLRAARESELWHIELEGERVRAPILINAAGAWADEVARSCQAPLMGFTPLRRTALLIDRPEGVDITRWPAVIDVDEQFYFKPDAGKLLLSPADETPDSPRDAFPEDLDVAIAVDRVQAALDIEIDRVSHSWAGLRTFSPDRAPVIGYDAAMPGFFWCAGQGGYGIQTAPAMARLAAALVRREPLPTDVAAEGLSAADISPERFAAG
jgi:D-arginine dehydrogenase